MIKQLQYVFGEGFDPYENLALEEALLCAVPPETCILYLWQNQKTVVIGKNQNAWGECKIAALEADGGRLARRLSGGGAVFHDLGNLNFTFLVNRDDYDVDKQLEVILEAVKSFGIRAEKSGRNDITADGRKFSGNAFYKTAAGCYHHGTLLLDVDMSRLSDYLNVSMDKLASKGVDSVKARVINLCELSDEITVDNMKMRLLEAFGKVYGGIPQELDLAGINLQKRRELYEKYASWEWRLGRKIPFSFAFSRRFPWGNIELQLSVDGGKIAHCNAFSDAMDADLIEQIPRRLTGCVCASQTLADALQGDDPTLADIRALILEQNF
ncbi:lipoate--protein ligase [Oscillospiraceae bacterium PP1C4]